MKDALGNDLIIGQTYGYSRNHNGLTTVKVGKLVKITAKQVSLEVEQSKGALYNRDVKDQEFTNKTISVHANGLFPVYTELLETIREKSNLENMCSAKEMQYALEEIHDSLQFLTASN
jgi:hypothetical protein